MKMWENISLAIKHGGLITPVARIPAQTWENSYYYIGIDYSPPLLKYNLRQHDRAARDKRQKKLFSFFHADVIPIIAQAIIVTRCYLIYTYDYMKRVIGNISRGIPIFPAPGKTLSFMQENEILSIQRQTAISEKAAEEWPKADPVNQVGNRQKALAVTRSGRITRRLSPPQVTHAQTNPSHNIIVCHKIKTLLLNKINPEP